MQKQLAIRPLENSQEILTIIRRIIRSLNLESKRINKEYGITIPQLLCLNHLYHSIDHQASHKELTRVLNLNSSTVTGIIDRLEKKNLVARLPKKDDKRITHIALTAKGASLLDRTPRLMQEELSAKLSRIPEEEIAHIKNSLEKLASMLGIEELEASPLLTVEEPIHQKQQPGSRASGQNDPYFNQ